MTSSVQPVQRARRAWWPARAALVLNLSLALSYAGLWGIVAAQGLFWRADFTAYYTGWTIAREGEGHRLYDFDEQARVQQRILEGRSFSDGLLPYLNPPYATIPFVPLSLLPLSTAFWAWSLLQVGVLALVARALLQIAAGWEPHERWLMLAAAAAFPPLLYTFQLGAFSLFMLLCLLRYYTALKAGRSAPAAAWLLAGTLKPQAMLLPGAALLVGRRWRALGAAVLGGVALVVVSGAALGWASWPGFLRALGTVNSFYGRFGIEPAAMYNLKGTLTLLLGAGQGELITRISNAAFVAAGALALWLWRGPWRPEDTGFELRMGLTILLGLLFSPHLHPQDGVMFIAPAVLFYCYLRGRGLPRAAFAALALASPALTLATEFTVGERLGVRLPVVLMGLLALWMGAALVAERRAGPGTAPPGA